MTASLKSAITGQTYVSPVTGTWAANPGNLYHDPRGGSREHSGNDLNAAAGSPVVAVIGGTVQYVGNNKGYNNNVVIIGDDGYAYRYAPHEAVTVKVGQKVKQGQQIGVIGGAKYYNKKGVFTGETAPHLHFEVIAPGSAAYRQIVDPKRLGMFTPTSTFPGGPVPTVDPLSFFGAAKGIQITAGQAIGDGSRAIAKPAAVSTTKIADLGNSPGAMPAAMPTKVDPTVDHLARVMLAEARGEGDVGMLSVGFVANNRAQTNGKTWSKDVNEVLSQSKQFAAPLDRSKISDADYANAVKLASQALYRTVPDPTQGATFFWNPITANQSAIAGIAASEPFKGKIGNHVFYGNADLGPLITPTPDQYGRFLADLPGLSEEDRAKLLNPAVLLQANAAAEAGIPQGVQVADQSTPLRVTGAEEPAVQRVVEQSNAVAENVPLPRPRPTPPVQQAAVPPAAEPPVQPAAFAPPAASPPATPKQFPPGKYGEGALLQAMVNNDPSAMAVARDRTQATIFGIYNTQGMAAAVKAGNEVKAYFEQAAKDFPAEMQIAKQNWETNPKLQEGMMPQVKKMADGVFAAVAPPISPAPLKQAPAPVPPAIIPAAQPIVANVPLPRLRPQTPPRLPAAPPTASPVLANGGATPFKIPDFMKPYLPSPAAAKVAATAGSSTNRMPATQAPQQRMLQSTSPTMVARPTPTVMRPAPAPVTTTVARPVQPMTTTQPNPVSPGARSGSVPGMEGRGDITGAGIAQAAAANSQKLQALVQQVAPAIRSQPQNIMQSVPTATPRSPLISSNGEGSKLGVTPSGQQYATRANPNGTQTLSWYRSDSTPDNPKVITVNINSQGEATSTTGAKGGSILCYYFYEIGWLSQSVWRAETRWAARNVPTPMRVGYYSWAGPILEKMRQPGLRGAMWRWAMWPIVKGWATEIAFVAGVELKGSRFGKLVRRVLEPYSMRIGRRMYAEHGRVV